MRLRIRQRVEEPLPVVERHVRIRPLGQDVACQDRQAREECPPLRLAPDVTQVEQRAGRVAEAALGERGARLDLRDGIREHDVGHRHRGSDGEAVPPEVPLHECPHLRRVGLEVEVKLLRGGDLELRPVAHATGQVQVLVRLEDGEDEVLRGPAEHAQPVDEVPEEVVGAHQLDGLRLLQHADGSKGLQRLVDARGPQPSSPRRRASPGGSAPRTPGRQGRRG